MQPDLLSPEKEENLPETVSPNAIQIEQSFETVIANPAAPKKRSKLNLAYLAMGVLALLLIAAFGWVGYWAYSLSTELTDNQQQLAGLQADYDRLQKDYTALKSESETQNAELAQTRTDLEKANADLATAQTELASSQDENKSLSNKIDQASKLADVLQTFTSIKDETDFIVLARQIKDAHHEGLSKAWSDAATFPSEESFNKFLSYLILAIGDSLD